MARPPEKCFHRRNQKPSDHVGHQNSVHFGLLPSPGCVAVMQCVAGHEIDSNTPPSSTPTKTKPVFLSNNTNMFFSLDPHHTLI